MKLIQRIFLLIMVVVFLSTLANFLLSQYQGEVLHIDSEKILVKTIAHSLSDTLVQDVIDGNKLRVTDVLKKLQSHDNPIEYLYITNGGPLHVFAHSFEKGFPRYLLDHNEGHLEKHLAQTGIELTKKIQTERGLIYVYAEPLLPGLEAILHIGINQSEIKAQLAENRQAVLMTSIAIMLLALVLAYYWSKQITTPLARFAEQIQRFGSGEVVNFSGVKKNVPEIRLLATAFQAATEERQQALTALQEREQNLDITLNSIGDAVIATDADGNITRMNPVAAQLTGWSLEEVRGQSLKSIFPIIDASTRETIENPVEIVIATGETVYLSNHTTLISRDGTEYQIADSAAPIRNEDNDILGMVLVFNDVTEAYQLRQAVVKSEEKYQTLAKIAPVGIFYTDEQGKCLYVNEKWSEITGISSEEAAGDGWVKGLHLDDRELVFAQWNEAAEQNIAFKLEYRFQQADGVHWVLGQALAEEGADGDIVGYVGTITDITERKKSENVLAQSSKEWTFAMDFFEDAIYLIDLDDKLVRANRAFYRMTGLSPELTVGRDITTIIHPDGEDVPCPVCKARRERRDEVIIMESDHPDNPTGVPIQITVQVVRDSEGVALSVLMGIRDLSNIRETEEENARLQHQLHQSQKMDALGKLTGGIAHDYNNMLGVVLGYAELLEGMLSDQPKLAAYVHKIRHAGERGAGLTAKLLTFSRQKTSDAEMLDINMLLQGEQDMLEKTLTVRINLVFDLVDDLWPVWLDSNDLEDAIVNLSINALHAIDGNGQLTIQTCNEHMNEIDARQLQMKAGDYVLLSITDTGCGMDDITKEKMFEPFYSTKGDKGTGLGLSQVYGFIERSEGVIKVYSELDYGTRIVFYFPRYQETASDEKREEQNDVLDFKGNETILVVDDESALLDLTCEILEQQGYHTLRAKNAKQTLDILEQQAVDLLICDIIMPEMDGYELAGIVQQKYPEIKIQLASGFADDRHVNMVDDDLHKNLLHKPYRSQILLKRVWALLHN